MAEATASQPETTPYRTLADLEPLAGKRVLVRVDFNVPIDRDRGVIEDDARIVESLPTIRYLLDRGAAVILLSHWGRPRGWDPRASLGPVARRLQELLAPVPVAFVDDVAGEAAQAAARALAPGAVLLLENVRFDPRETAGDDSLARALAQLADAYVDDAFGAAHRAHASIVGVPRYLPAAAGFLMQAELRALDEILGHPARPYWAIIGGAKVSDKAVLLEELLRKVDGLVIGGAMANTFLAADGVDVGRSKVEVDAFEAARHLLDTARRRGIPVLLPVDVVVAAAFAADAPHRVTAVDAIGSDEMALDIGPKTVAAIGEALAGAATVFWNGPMGVFEWPPFAEGTLGVAHLLAELGAQVVVGGGDSLAAVTRAGVRDRLTHVSTGGGASLEYLEGKPLPGVEALRREGRRADR
ncbi:MAG: phosphoglycerate kinase [Firmicutes bacterium]|nr:phosphoglycerate kinase [Alicyclobacillaceae bacterium]MCL6498010.1 phosphoglycerate kinase [Bacillota bacterium]